MMKYLLFFLLFCIYGTQYAYSLEDISKGDECISFNGVDNSRRYILYKFGLFSMYIVEGDKSCDVYMSDSKNLSFLTSCETSPILKWAFEEAPNELANAQFMVDKEYNPLYYSLSLQDGCTTIMFDSSSRYVEDNKDLAAKFHSLKGLIMQLWVDYYFNTKCK